MYNSCYYFSLRLFNITLMKSFKVILTLIIIIISVYINLNIAFNWF